MNDCPCPTGRPTPAALLLGFAGAALTCLLCRELLLACGGNVSAMSAALAVLPLAMAAGHGLAQRLDPAVAPADRLAPVLGLLALAGPLTLLVLPAVLPMTAPAGLRVTPASIRLTASALLAFVPLGLLLGAGLILTAVTAARMPRPPRLPLPVSLAAGAALGGLFVAFVAIPKLSPLNAALDAGIGCCAAGVLCAAGAPNSRQMETWLSLLAFGYVLVLPLSGVLDVRLTGWLLPGPAGGATGAPLAVAGLPPEGLLAVVGAVGPVLAVAAVLLWQAQEGLAMGPLGEGLLDASLFAGLVFAFRALGGELATRLPLLLAAWAAGQALALARPGRRTERRATLLPSAALFYGYALGLFLPAVLILF